MSHERTYIMASTVAKLTKAQLEHILYCVYVHLHPLIANQRSYEPISFLSIKQVKPDGVERGLVGEIIRRFENKGFQLLGLQMLSVS